MRDALAHVEPELRSPALPFVTVTYSDKALPVIRAVYRVKSSPGSGVNVATRTIGDVIRMSSRATALVVDR